MDEYSRYVVHHELVLGMDGVTVSLAAQTAIAKLPRGPEGLPLEKPTIRSDNGSGYVSQEFRVVLKENGLDHQRIKPHCPEENGLMERANRTIREHLEGEELKDLVQAQSVLRGSSGVTTRSGCTVRWVSCDRRTTTAATRHRSTQRGD